MSKIDPRAAAQYRIATDYQASTATCRQQADGVVVTPVEVVDYQIRALIDRLTDMGSSLADPRVRVLDPFGGTGIYLARLLQLAPLNRPEKVALAGRCRMIEIDPDACEVARANLAAVMAEETGRPDARPVVLCADTFALGDELWEMTEEVRP